jgi:hypothetical protein
MFCLLHCQLSDLILYLNSHELLAFIYYIKEFIYENVCNNTRFFTEWVCWDHQNKMGKKIRLLASLRKCA